MLAAVSQHGEALEFASEELRADEEAVLAAVEQNANALQFASPELRRGGLEQFITRQLESRDTFLRVEPGGSLARALGQAQKGAPLFNRHEEDVCDVGECNCAPS